MEFEESKICDWCGNPFEAKTKRHRFCNSNCQYENAKIYARRFNKEWRARRRKYPQEAICIICKTPFSKLKPTHLTCGSEECIRKRRSDYKKQIYSGVRKVTKVYNLTLRKY
jgi:hypothetical protein